MSTCIPFISALKIVAECTFSHFLLKLAIIWWQDEEAFFKDYAISHKKLSELGFSPRSSSSKLKDGVVLAQGAVGVAVAAAVVVLSYIYEVRKRRKWKTVSQSTPA